MEHIIKAHTTPHSIPFGKDGNFFSNIKQKNQKNILNKAKNYTK